MRAYNNWYLSIFDKLNNMFKNVPKVTSCEFKRLNNECECKIIIIFDDILSFNVIFSGDTLKIFKVCEHENTLDTMLHETEVLSMNAISLSDSDDVISMYVNIILWTIILHDKEFNDRKIS